VPHAIQFLDLIFDVTDMPLGKRFHLRAGPVLVLP